jgi:type II secretory pathway pseudopilin PulG
MFHYREWVMVEKAGIEIGAGEKRAIASGMARAGNFRQAAALARQHGVISIEAIVVIAVILVLLVWGGARITQLYLGTDNTTEAGNVQSLYGAIREVKTTAGYGTNGTDLSGLLIAMGKVPGNMPISGTQIMNTWGQPYAILSTGQGFTVSDPGVPEKNCIKIVSSVSQNGQFATTTVNGGTPFSGAMASADGQTACSSDPSTILWTSTN